MKFVEQKKGARKDDDDEFSTLAWSHKNDNDCVHVWNTWHHVHLEMASGLQSERSSPHSRRVEAYDTQRALVFNIDVKARCPPIDNSR